MIESNELAWRMRCHAIDMVHASHASHIGAILSATDIIAVLYANILHIDPQIPTMPERDRFVMSKGHAGVAVYAALAEMGFFPVEDLTLYYTDGSVYSGHVSHRGVPGVEFSTGSLGHGIAVACGMALAGKMHAIPYHVYALAGDGECNEGTVWETALLAQQYKLDNFTVIVDRNGMQAMGNCSDVMNLEPFADKWRSFGWTVVDVTDGNDHDQLRAAFAAPFDGRPKCIIANTVKGKGISFMEHNLTWHYRDPQNEFYSKAVAELEAIKNEEYRNQRTGAHGGNR